MRKRGKAVGIFVFLFKNNLKTSVSIFWHIIIIITIIITLHFLTLKIGVQGLSLIQVLKMFSQ